MATLHVHPSPYHPAYFASILSFLLSRFISRRRLLRRTVDGSLLIVCREVQVREVHVREVHVREAHVREVHECT